MVVSSHPPLACDILHCYLAVLALGTDDIILHCYLTVLALGTGDIILHCYLTVLALGTGAVLKFLPTVSSSPVWEKA